MIETLNTPVKISSTTAYRDACGSTATISDCHLCFKSLGRKWAFYSTGRAIAYRHCLDYWSAGITLDHTVRTDTTTMSSALFHLWLDGNAIHTTWVKHLTDRDELLYRYGLLNSGGTIAWSSPESVITGAVGINYWSANVCVDSYGYPYVIICEDETAGGHVYLAKSSSKTSWVTAPGFPIEALNTAEIALHDDYNIYPGQWWGAQIVPLDNGHLYMIYQKEFTHLWGKEFDGSGFLADELAWPYITSEDKTYNTSSFGNTVYLVAHANYTFSNRMTLSIRENGVWSPPVILGDSLAMQDKPAICMHNGSPFIVWQDRPNEGSNEGIGDIKYAYYDNEDLITGTYTNTSLSSGWNLASYHTSVDDEIGFLFAAPGEYPRDVWFGSIKLISEETINMVTFTGKVSLQYATGEQVVVDVTKPDSTHETVTANTDANGDYSCTYEGIAGEYSAVASVAADGKYTAASSPVVNFTINLEPRTITLNVS